MVVAEIPVTATDVGNISLTIDNELGLISPESINGANKVIFEKPLPPAQVTSIAACAALETDPETLIHTCK